MALKFLTKSTNSFVKLDSIPIPLQYNFANHLRKNTFEYLWQFVILCAIVTLLVIHTSTPVTLIIKLMGGASPSWLGAVWYLSALISVFLLVITFFPTLMALIYAWPFFLISFFAIASVSWSIAPSDSMKGAIFLNLSQIAAVALAVRLSWEDILKLFSTLLTVLIGLSVLLAVAMPSIGQMQTIYPGAWSGLWAEKQALGFYAVFQIIFTILHGIYSKGQRKWLLAAPLGVIAIIGTQGKTAIIMVIVAFAAIAFVRIIQQGPRIMLATIWLGIVFAAALWGIFLLDPNIIFTLTGKSSDLTGRKEIWEGIEYLTNQRPTFGWGYKVIWDGQKDLTSPYQWISGIADFEPSNSHSSYWDALLSMGQIGLVLLIIALSRTFLSAIVKVRRNIIGSSLSIAVLASMLMISFTETVFLGDTNLTWFLVVMLGTKVAMPADNPAPPLPQPSQNNDYQGHSFTY